MALHSLNKIRGLNDPLKQFQVTFAISNAPALALAKSWPKSGRCFCQVIMHLQMQKN